VSPGIGSGRVRVVVRPEGLDRVGPGEVMVSPAADSAWTFVFGRLSALVLERGGQLSHASVVAREYGLPAVAGVRDATRILRDGDRVIVDGTRGLVLKC
jgi:phosphoenolpyruvate synthase/pyruvate phosphate dikinase